jgi:hypothetical protein
MTFIAEGFLEMTPGFVQTAVKIVREGASGFYNVTLANGGVVRHVAGKFLTFRSFSDDAHAPVTIVHAKTYPARDSDAYTQTQSLYEQLRLW